MPDDIKISVQVLACPSCGATGLSTWQKCAACGGMAMGVLRRGHWLYWSYPLTRYHLALERSRRIFNRVRRYLGIFIGLNFWLWGGLAAYRLGLLQQLGLLINGKVPTVSFHIAAPILADLLFGLLFFCYVEYRSIVEKPIETAVEQYDYSQAEVPEENTPLPTWDDVKKMPRRQRRSVSDSYTNEARKLLENAYRMADRLRHAELLPIHIIAALAESDKIATVFIRLGVSVKTIEQKLRPLLPPVAPTTLAPTVSREAQEILFAAYDEAYRAHQHYVGDTDLLVSVVRLSPALQDVLSDVGIDHQKLINVVEWVRVREHLMQQYHKLRRAAGHRSKYGMDKAMTAVATPYLNRFSDDVTMLAQFGHTEECVAREKEVESIFRVVEGGQQNVLLVGDFGVGKKSIVEGLAGRMVEDDVPKRLQDKRMVRLSVSSLLAGTTPSGAVERLIAIMNEIARAGNIILFIHNIHELIGVSAGGQDQSLDVAGTLAEYIGGGRFMTIATTTTEAFGQLVSNSKLGTLFSKVEIAEMDENQTIQVLESKAGYIEYKQQVFFAYEAVEKAAQLAKRFIREVTLPGSALEVMSEAASFTHSKKGHNTLVTGEEVAAVVAQKTKIPVTAVSADESEKLLHLEAVLHQRVIGQDEAVNLVASALRRARAQIRSQNRPIANFLFLGPTGVGKTELAKTIAEVYFGGEERMIRLDMSEYQDKASIYRLIGRPGEKGSGVLTEAVRRAPFALVLLDEIEKADKDILNLFLQVMDDGRLTDSVGRVVDFTNVILIATSNAGTNYVQDQLHAGISSEAIKERLLHGELRDYFRPEFLNRFDGIVLFRALDQAAIKQIAGIMLKHVAADLAVKGITLNVTDDALNYFASIGFDPDFGARPMRRVVQERVENALAELLLSKSIGRHSTVVIGAEGKVSVQ